jgi:hypothetical protein
MQPYMTALNKSVDYLETTRFQLTNNNKLLRKKEFYLQEINRLGDIYSAEDTYLRSTKKSLATAEIQQIFKNLAEKSKAELVSTQVTDIDVNNENSVGLSVRLKADIFSLQKLIYAIEVGSPRLIIREISIHRGNRAIFRFSGKGSSSQMLDVRLQVFGYVDAK